jgi:hypothetical protein
LSSVATAINEDYERSLIAMSLAIRAAAWQGHNLYSGGMRLRIPLATVLLTLALAATANASSTVGAVAPTTAGNDPDHTDRTYVQVETHPGAPSYVIPSSGIATSFSLRLGTAAFPTDKIRFYTFEPVTTTTFRATADSGPLLVPPSSATQVVTLPIRQKVEAGQLLGLGLDISGTTWGTFTAVDATTSDDVIGITGFPELGTLGVETSQSLGYHLNMRAVVEPDVDHDGFGDETQDGCPADRSDSGPCTAPGISDFKFSLNKFAVEKKGIVLNPAATAQGTNVIITLSKASRVSFEMSQKAAGRKVGSSCKKPTSKNRKKKKCTRYLKPYKFVRVLPAGTSNLGFSGRIRVGSKKVALPVGKYRATASPVSSASNIVGAPATTNFTVVKPAKKKG